MMNDRNDNDRRDRPGGPEEMGNTGDIEWIKDEEETSPPEAASAGEKKPFDFESFLNLDGLGLEDLEDKITDVLDGKDLLDPEAYGEFAPDYIPRRPRAGEGGRHMAPSTDDEEEPELNDIAPEPDWEQQNPDPEEEQEEQVPPRPNFDELVPPRPKVVVAEPAHTVYVKPDSEYGDYDGGSRRDTRSDRNDQGLRGWQKGLIAIVIAAAVIIVGFGVLTNMLGGSSTSDEAEATATPASTNVLSGLLTSATATPGTATMPPVATNSAATPVSATTYSITVTSGNGGSISPSGVVSVEEGGSVTFTITPNNGYEISQLLVDGTSVSPGSSYTFSNVTSNHTIYAVFQPVATATETPVPTAEPTAEPTPAPTDNAPPAAVETDNGGDVGGNVGGDAPQEPQDNSGGGEEMSSDQTEDQG
ncbi:MAG: hypothetical protein LUE22_00335 [Oscillospiraceae bacterium]|nr:hypothetical protein [Oscillospiraceae bacterium]